MTLYHINNAGNAGTCYAQTEESCRFKREHFPTMEEARAHYEKENEIFSPSIAKSWRTKLVKIGAGLLATIALTNVGSIAAQAAPMEQSFLDDILNEVNANSSHSQNYGKTLDQIDSLLEKTEYSKDFKNSREFLDSILNDNEETSSDSSYDRSIATDGVYFQGKSLEVSADELAKAQATLDTLTVKPENTNYNYDRAGQYGRSFQTGVAGRLEHRDITNGVFKNDSPQARAIAGDFVDPYTGKTVEVIKGSSTDTNIDHIVPLHEVAKSEDSNNPLSKSEKMSIANDFDNLQIVAGKVNKQKSDKDPSQWMPSYAPSKQAYAVSYINVKAKYNLSVDQAEYNALSNTVSQ